MRPLAFWLFGVLAFALATALFGWWAVPVLAAAWALAGRLRPHWWWRAGLAASSGWATLLVLGSLRGPVGELATRVSGVLALPGFALYAFTLLFPALLAASAAELGTALRSLLARPRRPAH